MEVLPVIKNKGAIVALTATPQVIDLRSFIGGYVRLSCDDPAIGAYVCALPSATAPGTVHTAGPTTGQPGHASCDAENVADRIALGTLGTHRVVDRALPYLWVRTISGTCNLTIKPAGRPGEAA